MSSASESYTPPETSDHLVVYLDTSASMEGYVSPDRKRAGFGAQDDAHTVFTHTLRALRDEVTTTFSPPINVVYRQVASKVSDPTFSDLKLAEAAITRSLYKDGETNLAGAITLFSSPLPGAGSARQGAGDGTRQAPPRFHILVTDGVQSTRQQRTDMNCMSGSDSVCVKNAISSLLRAGWGGTVLGVKSEFRGNVYPEVRPGSSFEYSSVDADVQTFRPFYLYIFSPDREALDKLVQALKARLKQIKSLRGREEAVREYALTSAYTEGQAGAEILIPKDSSDYLERTRGRDEEKPARLTLKVDVDTEKRGPQPFSIMLSVPWSGHARDSGPPDALPTLLRWDLVPVEPPAAAERGGAQVRHPEVRLLGPRPAPDGRIELQATAHWPAGTGETRWRAYRLEGRLNLDQRAPPWVALWSANTDESPGTATKTFNLESSLANLWRNPVLERQLVAEVYLRVGPK